MLSTKTKLEIGAVTALLVIMSLPMAILCCCTVPSSSSSSSDPSSSSSLPSSSSSLPSSSSSIPSSSSSLPSSSSSLPSSSLPSSSDPSSSFPSSSLPSSSLPSSSLPSSSSSQPSSSSSQPSSSDSGSSSDESSSPSSTPTWCPQLWIGIFKNPGGGGLCTQPGPPAVLMGTILQNCNFPTLNPEYEIFAVCSENNPGDCVIGDPDMFTSLVWVQEMPEDIAAGLGLLGCYTPSGNALPECCEEDNPGPLSILAYIPTPGTELKNILQWFVWSKKARECKTCKDRESTMNSWGPDKCLQNIGVISGWLKESAEEKGYPFSERIARAMIRKAIDNSRKPK